MECTSGDKASQFTSSEARRIAYSLFLGFTDDGETYWDITSTKDGWTMGYSINPAGESVTKTDLEKDFTISVDVPVTDPTKPQQTIRSPSSLSNSNVAKRLGKVNDVSDVAQAFMYSTYKITFGLEETQVTTETRLSYHLVNTLTQKSYLIDTQFLRNTQVSQYNIVKSVERDFFPSFSPEKIIDTPI